MGLGWHPIDEMENKTCLKPPTILLFNGWSGTSISGNLHLEDMFMKHIVMVFMDHCTFWRKRWGMIYMVISNFLKSTWIHGAKYGNIHHIVNWNCPSRTQYWIYIYNPLLPRTKLNVVVQVKPWLYLKTLIDCWYIGHTKGQKRVTFPLSLIESVNQSSKFWIKICGFHAQVFDWFSRAFHCLFTGFSRSFHALFTL